MLVRLLKAIKKIKDNTKVKTKLPKVKRPAFTIRVDEIHDRHWFIQFFKI